jgi:hypothetical protein
LLGLGTFRGPPVPDADGPIVEQVPADSNLILPVMIQFGVVRIKG